jgi:S-DNA-T family DNA segregation ATPase FtsK/SpoIIIE
MGLGAVFAVVLALPDGGSVAAPIHDGLFLSFGVAAWLACAGLVVTGVRTCGKRQWHGGLMAAMGSFIVVAAALGLAGIVAPDAAGKVGATLGSALAQRLGSAAAVVAWLVAVICGLVLAIDLRMEHIKQAVVAATTTTGSPKPKTAVPKKPKAEPEVVAELTGSRIFPPESVVDLGLTPESEPEAEVSNDGFEREFEGVVEHGAEPSLGSIPDVEISHARDDIDGEQIHWVLPTTDLLDIVSGKRERLTAEVQQTAHTIVTTLKSFGVETSVIGANSGPTVTQYELQPGPGVPVRRIVGYQTDLSVALAAPVRIQPFIAGKTAMGIEVPNKAAQLVALKEVVEASAFSDAKNRMAVALGADVSGHPVIGDLTRMPHMLIAGATGSGKSVCINAILAGFMLQATPAEMKLILIDPKRVELSNFADLPHLLVPVVVEPEAAVGSLRWAVKEMEERYKLFASHGARNIAVFNERAPSLGLQPLQYIVIVIDELADLMMVAAGEIEDLICRVAQLARAVGIHLIVATQRPSADIITGLIKANIPSRVAFAVSSGVDSRVILDEMGAEKLLGRGDMLYMPIDEGKPRRLQGAFCSDSELEALINHWKAQGKPEYQEEIFNVEATVSWADKAAKRDVLFAKAAHLVAAEGRAAASLLQRKMSIGYTRAARLVDQLADAGVVGPYEGSKSREIRMDVLEVDQLLADLGEE